MVQGICCPIAFTKNVLVLSIALYSVHNPKKTFSSVLDVYSLRVYLPCAIVFNPNNASSFAHGLSMAPFIRFDLLMTHNITHTQLATSRNLTQVECKKR